MIELKWTKKFGVIYKDLYFHNEEQIGDYDIASFIESFNKPLKRKYQLYTTLFTDLKLSIEELEEKIEKQCRYEIRRATNKDMLKVKAYKPDEITDEILNSFIEHFNRFAKQKKLSSCDPNFLKSAKEQGFLYLTCASNEEEVLVWHSYLGDGKITRLLQSCSSYREADGQYRNLVGRANRLLHWEDEKTFKGMGYETYDWGGISNREEIRNITAFKKSFGGEQVDLYNYRMTNTFKGRVYSFVTRILSIFKKR